MLTRRQQVVLRLGGTAIGVALLVLCLRQIELPSLVAALQRVRWPWIAAALAANSLILVSWAALWWSTAPQGDRVAYSAMFRINAMASAAMNTMPLLGGHAMAIVLLTRRAGVSLHSALSILALDQLGEGLAKVIVLSVAAFAAPVPEWMRVAWVAGASIVGLFLILLVAAARWHARIRSRRVEKEFLDRIRIFVGEWANRLETLRSPGRSGLALGYAIGTKAAEGLGIWAVQRGLGVELSIGATSLILGAVVLGTLVPLTPGNVGTYEGVSFAAYRHLGVDPSTSAALAVATHVCFLLPSLAIGYGLAGRQLWAGKGWLEASAS